MFQYNSKTWNKDDYPENWKELARICKEVAQYKCMRCKKTPKSKYISKNGNTCYKRLAACHAIPTEEKSTLNPLLICLCETCHAWYDAPYKSVNTNMILTRDRARLAIKGVRPLDVTITLTRIAI